MVEKMATSVEIDSNSGFCFGVINAIKTAEEWLQREKTLFCLGDIVHNNEELQRLQRLGLRVISRDEFAQLHNVRVLIRAHGEPPETYEIAKSNNIEIIDATCKVVLNLQKTIRQCCDGERQILIFGKQGHAEVVGLIGQTKGNGIVVSSLGDIAKIDFSRPAYLFSQTTQNLEQYRELIAAISLCYQSAGNQHLFHYKDTICHSVVNRAKQIEQFASKYDMVIFVSGEKSSNGLYLFDICKKSNSNSFFISHLEQLSQLTINQGISIGICGATSTPMWLMEAVKQRLTMDIPFKINQNQQ